MRRGVRFNPRVLPLLGKVTDKWLEKATEAIKRTVGSKSDRAAREAEEVAGQARQKTGEMASEAKEKAGDMASQAKQKTEELKR